MGFYHQFDIISKMPEYNSDGSDLSLRMPGSSSNDDDSSSIDFDSNDLKPKRKWKRIKRKTDITIRIEEKSKKLKISNDTKDRSSSSKKENTNDNTKNNNNGKEKLKKVVVDRKIRKTPKVTNARKLVILDKRKLKEKFEELFGSDSDDLDERIENFYKLQKTLKLIKEFDKLSTFKEEALRNCQLLKVNLPRLSISNSEENDEKIITSDNSLIKDCDIINNESKISDNKSSINEGIIDLTQDESIIRIKFKNDKNFEIKEEIENTETNDSIKPNNSNESSSTDFDKSMKNNLEDRAKSFYETFIDLSSSNLIPINYAGITIEPIYKESTNTNSTTNTSPLQIVPIHHTEMVENNNTNTRIVPINQIRSQSGQDRSPSITHSSTNSPNQTNNNTSMLKLPYQKRTKVTKSKKTKLLTNLSTISTNSISTTTTSTSTTTTTRTSTTTTKTKKDRKTSETNLQNIPTESNNTSGRNVILNYNIPITNSGNEVNTIPITVSFLEPLATVTTSNSSTIASIDIINASASASDSMISVNSSNNSTTNTNSPNNSTTNTNSASNSTTNTNSASNSTTNTNSANNSTTNTNSASNSTTNTNSASNSTTNTNSANNSTTNTNSASNSTNNLTSETNPENNIKETAKDRPIISNYCGQRIRISKNLFARRQSNNNETVSTTTHTNTNNNSVNSRSVNQTNPSNNLYTYSNRVIPYGNNWTGSFYTPLNGPVAVPNSNFPIQTNLIPTIQTFIPTINLPTTTTTTIAQLVPVCANVPSNSAGTPYRTSSNLWVPPPPPPPVSTNSTSKGTSSSTKTRTKTGTRTNTRTRAKTNAKTNTSANSSTSVNTTTTANTSTRTSDNCSTSANTSTNANTSTRTNARTNTNANSSTNANTRTSARTNTSAYSSTGSNTSAYSSTSANTSTRTNTSFNPQNLVGNQLLPSRVLSTMNVLPNLQQRLPINNYPLPSGPFAPIRPNLSQPSTSGYRLITSVPNPRQSIINPQNQMSSLPSSNHSSGPYNVQNNLILTNEECAERIAPILYKYSMILKNTNFDFLNNYHTFLTNDEFQEQVKLYNTFFNQNIIYTFGNLLIKELSRISVRFFNISTLVRVIILMFERNYRQSISSSYIFRTIYNILVCYHQEMMKSPFLLTFWTHIKTGHEILSKKPETNNNNNILSSIQRQQLREQIKQYEKIVKLFNQSIHNRVQQNTQSNSCSRNSIYSSVGNTNSPTSQQQQQIQQVQTSSFTHAQQQRKPGTSTQQQEQQQTQQQEQMQVETSSFTNSQNDQSLQRKPVSPSQEQQHDDLDIKPNLQQLQSPTHLEQRQEDLPQQQQQQLQNQKELQKQQQNLSPLQQPKTEQMEQEELEEEEQGIDRQLEEIENEEPMIIDSDYDVSSICRSSAQTHSPNTTKQTKSLLNDLLSKKLVRKNDNTSDNTASDQELLVPEPCDVPIFNMYEPVIVNDLSSKININSSSSTEPSSTNLDIDNNIDEVVYCDINDDNRSLILSTDDDPDLIDLTCLDDMDSEGTDNDIEFFPVKKEENEDNSEEEEGIITILDNSADKPNKFYTDKCICGEIAVYDCICQTAIYCSAKCQREDWEDHKRFHEPKQ